MLNPKSFDFEALWLGVALYDDDTSGWKSLMIFIYERRAFDDSFEGLKGVDFIPTLSSLDNHNMRLQLKFVVTLLLSD